MLFIEVIWLILFLCLDKLCNHNLKSNFFIVYTNRMYYEDKITNKCENYGSQTEMPTKLVRTETCFCEACTVFFESTTKAEERRLLGLRDTVWDQNAAVHFIFITIIIINIQFIISRIESFLKVTLEFLFSLRSDTIPKYALQNGFCLTITLMLMG